MPVTPQTPIHIHEIGQILFAGLTRLLNKKSNQILPLSKKISLDFSATESGRRRRKYRKPSDE
jgi:hypothetical protein